MRCQVLLWDTVLNLHSFLVGVLTNSSWQNAPLDVSLQARAYKETMTWFIIREPHTEIQKQNSPIIMIGPFVLLIK